MTERRLEELTAALNVTRQRRYAALSAALAAGPTPDTSSQPRLVCHRLASPG